MLGNNKEKKGDKRKNKKIKDKEGDDIIIEFVKNEEDLKDGKEYTRNKTSKNHEFKGKTRIISVDKKNNKFNNDKSNLTNKTNMYETFSKQNEYNNINNFPNKYETKPKKNKVIFTNIFSPIIDIKNNKDSSKINNIISNSERENIYNSEAITNYGQSFNNSKKAKLMNNKIRFKGGKYKIQNKIGKTKDKENTIKETGTNLNMEEKSKRNRIRYGNKIVNIANTDEDYQGMDFDEAYQLDKRNCLRMYWSFLVDTQIILGTFFTSNFLYLFIVKLSFLVSTFQISFFLNALFYTDEYISDAYHNDGVLDFFSGLPKSIYSFLATLITTSLLGMLSNSKSELIDTIKERKNKKEYLEQINAKLNKLKNKLIIYYSFLFLLGLFFLYYVSAFCAVYRYSQKYWLYGCFESFAIDSLVSITICVFLSLFRYIAVHKRIRYLYILVKIINSFL